MPFLETTDGVRLFYNDWGAGRPVVLVHGWPLNSDMWASQAVFLAEHGARVVAYDRRGFGRSDQPWDGHDFDTLADDLAALMDHLDLRDAVLVGFSIGTGDVARYLSRHGSGRVSRVALVSCDLPYLIKAHDNPDGIDPSVFAGMRRALEQDRPQFLAEFSATYFGNTALHRRVSDEYLRATVRMGTQASLRAALEGARHLATTDFRPDAAAIDRPALIIHGTGDHTAPIAIAGRAAAALIRGSRLLEYEGEPHALYATAPDRLNHDLLAFASG